MDDKRLMTAANLYAPGDLRAEEISVPECKEGEVLVKIKNCGVCGSDVGRILVNGTYHFPTVPGHEFSGEVVFDKTGEFTGKRVTVFPLIPCRKCDMCGDLNFAQCRDYDYYGSRRNGGFAEFLAVKKENLLCLPDNVDFETGAMCEPMAVALHAVKKLNIDENSVLLITGAGTIGLIAGKWARKFGAKEIYYLDIDERKLEFAEKFGFKRYDGNVKPNKVLEGTGAASALASAITAADMFADFVLMGNPARDVSLSAKDYQAMLRKELTLAGTWNSSFSEKQNDWKECVKALEDGSMSISELITHRISLSELGETVRKMKEGKEFFCKVVTVNDR